MLLRFISVLLWCGSALAAERVEVCYNYGCLAEAVVSYSEAQLNLIGKSLAAAKSPAQERALLAPVIGRMYYWAGLQSPIYADRGGNLADEAVNGSMDCIDHSTTTTRLLNVLAQRGMLRYHRVLPPVRRARFFIMEHYSAAIVEMPARWLPRTKIVEQPEAPDDVNAERFVVDSWFVSNGKPAVILPLDDWMSGAGPDIEPD